MTKNQLQQYLFLKKEKEQIEQEIEDFYETCIRPVILDDMPKGSGVSDPTSMLAERAAKLHTKLLYKKYEMVVALEAIEDCIDKLESRERVIMREYYINDLSWEQVAVKMDYSIQRIWQIHKEAIQKIRVF